MRDAEVASKGGRRARVVVVLPVVGLGARMDHADLGDWRREERAEAWLESRAARTRVGASPAVAGTRPSCRVGPVDWRGGRRGRRAAAELITRYIKSASLSLGRKGPKEGRTPSPRRAARSSSALSTTDSASCTGGDDAGCSCVGVPTPVWFRRRSRRATRGDSNAPSLSLRIASSTRLSLGPAAAAAAAA